MPSERVRNTAVGLTMLLALVILCAAIFMLGNFGEWTKGRPYMVNVLATNANGLNAGSKVELNGVYVGSIKNVYLDADGRKVHIILGIDRWVHIPGNVMVEIGKSSFGAPYITLHVPDQTSTLPEVPTDDTAVISNTKTETGLIPQNVFDTVQDLSKSLQALSVKLSLVSDDLHGLLQQRSTADVDRPDNPEHPFANISTLVQRLDRVANSLDKLIGDPKLQAETRQLVSNLAESSQSLKLIIHDARNTVPLANSAIERIGVAADKVSGAATQAGALAGNANRQLIPISEKLVDALSTLQKTLTAISEGKGTAGRFVQDPRLYEGLVDVTNQLKGTIDDLHALVREIRENGIGIHMGGGK